MEGKLINCHVCGKEIAQTADKYPYYGAITEWAKYVSKWIIITVISITAFILIIMVFS